MALYIVILDPATSDVPAVVESSYLDAIGRNFPDKKSRIYLSPFTYLIETNKSPDLIRYAIMGGLDDFANDVELFVFSVTCPLAIDAEDEKKIKIQEAALREMYERHGK